MTSLMVRAMRLGVVAWFISASAAQAQPPVAVTAADPPQGEQNTVGLTVRITGKNFANGARVDFFQSGTTNPAGIVVRGAAVNSSTEILATIDIDAAAALSFFDIRVTNQSGRSGKGSDLFQVVQKVTGNNACIVGPLPSNVTLVQQLNSLDAALQPRYRGALGHGMAARTVNIKGSQTLMLAAPAAPGIELFFLTEGAGGLASVDAINPHRRLTAPDMSRLFPAAIGDFNADGAPDVVAGNRLVGRAFVWLGSWDTAGELDFGTAIPIPPPSSVNYYSDDIAVGDLDSAWPGDEIAIGQWGVRNGKDRSVGRVYLYRVNGAAVEPLPQAIVIPTLTPAIQSTESYARSLTIADVTGSAEADLIVSASSRAVTTGGTGEVFVFPGPTFDADALTAGLQPHVIRPHTARDGWGFGLGAGDANGDGTADLLVTTFYNSPVVAVDTALGPVGPSQSTEAGYAVDVEQGDFSMGFGTTGVAVGDLDGDGITDMAVGAPDSTTGGSCSKQGTVFVWRGTGQSAPAWHAPLSLQAPERDASIAHFGWKNLVVQVGSLRFLVVGEPQRDLGGVEDAGQIYLYRVSTP